MIRLSLVRRRTRKQDGTPAPAGPSRDRARELGAVLAAAEEASPRGSTFEELAMVALVWMHGQGAAK